jgi:hypothetical protein
MVAANEEVLASRWTITPRLPIASMIVALLVATSPVVAANDPQPSWDDGTAKRAILAFVAETTKR